MSFVDVAGAVVLAEDDQLVSCSASTATLEYRRFLPASSSNAAGGRIAYEGVAFAAGRRRAVFERLPVAPSQRPATRGGYAPTVAPFPCPTARAGRKHDLVVKAHHHVEPPQLPVEPKIRPVPGERCRTTALQVNVQAVPSQHRGTTVVTLASPVRAMARYDGPVLSLRQNHRDDDRCRGGTQATAEPRATQAPEQVFSVEPSETPQLHRQAPAASDHQRADSQRLQVAERHRLTTLIVSSFPAGAARAAREPLFAGLGTHLQRPRQFSARAWRRATTGPARACRCPSGGPLDRDPKRRPRPRPRTRPAPSPRPSSAHRRACPTLSRLNLIGEATLHHHVQPGQ